MTAIQLSSLPLATQMLLDPAVVLDQDILEEWNAACAAAGSQSIEHTGVDVSSTMARGGVARRREPRRLVDTNDFLKLAEALDTLADELNVNAALGGASPSLAADPPAKAARRNLNVDELDPLGVDGLMGVQLEDAHEAHRLFGAKEYTAAMAAFLRVSSACLAHELTPALLNNVAVCHFVMEQWSACEAATRRVLAVDRTERYPSARRLVRVFISQGRLQEAQQAVSPHRDAIDWAAEVAAVKACTSYTNFYAAHQYSKALESLEVVLSLCPCGTLEAAKARLLSLENAAQAVSYAAQRSRAYATSTELHFCLWSLTFHSVTSVVGLDTLLADMQATPLGRSELRFRHLHTHIARCKEALAKLQVLKTARQWREAATFVTQVLAEPFLPDGLKGVMYYERARALAQQASWYATLDDTHRALSYTEAVSLRANMLLLVARCEEALGRLRDAVYHTEESLGLASNAAAVEQLRSLKARWAHVQASTDAPRTTPRTTSKETPKPNTNANAFSPVSRASLDVHYKTLSLPRSAGAAEVKKSYRALAIKWHPDRWCSASTEAIRTAESTFKTIQHAYEEIMKSAS
ncbi:putative chaperone protein DNAj [Leishmania major strain Friedlin]|uniref:Putative chaperone protein DNAj n=1 Tax=Leishmania major TaxID=5664 RepID=Q4QDM3_LEIMA|nr:putative chaperone protein DNAj [Leishmania major strain Friedlin]CAG9572554.1 chaperone_protein_DNAj_-_putative [Leishmania major strain Friedlin]CAJ04386.1 putative chaperone protein DNAj [Leishmania major strain Friedlin]|eukprot:XP_001682575.1 putative chaperone protein DNAj [Leishmania major strain Friedlin]